LLEIGAINLYKEPLVGGVITGLIRKEGRYREVRKGLLVERRSRHLVLLLLEDVDLVAK